MHIIAFHGTGVWARIDQVFAFDAVSYFLQAFAGEVLLIFPIVYGFTNSAPFNTWNIEFALYFFPFIITGILPTVAALGWQKTPSAKVSEAPAGGPCPCHFVLEKQEVRCPRDYGGLLPVRARRIGDGAPTVFAGPNPPTLQPVE